MSDQPVPPPVDKPADRPDIKKNEYRMVAVDLRKLIDDNLSKSHVENRPQGSDQKTNATEQKTGEQKTPETKGAEHKTHEQQIKDKLNFLDHAPLDVEKTPGHTFVKELEKGLQNKDPNAVAVAKLLTDQLFHKVEHAHDVLTYEANKGKLDELRANADMTKADGDALLTMLQPAERPLAMGEGGRVGSERSIDRQVAYAKVEAVLETKSTFGQLAAMNALLHGASPEQIRSLGSQASAYEGALGGLGSMEGARARNESVGKESVQANTERARQTSEVRQNQETPQTKEGAAPKATDGKLSPVESRNASLSTFGGVPKDGDPGTHTDGFSGEVSYITSSRRASPGANTADRATITEAQEYSKQIYVEGKVGIQRPGVVNEKGADFIVFNEKSGKVEVFDTKFRGGDGQFPKALSTQQMMAKWGNEVTRAIEGWTNKDGQHVGGVDTGDKALDNRIKEALKNGKVEHIQINVRGPELPTKAPHKLGPL